MPTPHGFVEKLAQLVNSGEPCVSVTMVEAIGSTPQDTGSKMLVSRTGLQYGTVGGGKVELKAIRHAQKLLDEKGANATAHQFVEWNLQRDVGMTCGGVVKLYFETYNHADWRVVIFGAGHCANAVVRCLSLIDCHTTCIDSRDEWLERIPNRERLTKICTADLASQVVQLPNDAFVICMTMGHATDRPVLEEIFRQQRQFPYLGVIGSRAKRKILVRELQQAGFHRQAEDFHCPIGLPLGTNQPGEIAVSLVAQLIQERDKWRHHGIK